MAKIGRTLTELAAEIERQANAKRDLIAPVAKMSMEVVDSTPVIAVHNGHIETFTANSIAHAQLAEYVGVPKAYYDRMATEAPTLLASNVNRWLADKAGQNDRRMVRTMDGRARAFLSDKYR